MILQIRRSTVILPLLILCTTTDMKASSKKARRPFSLEKDRHACMNRRKIEELSYLETTFTPSLN